MKSTTAVCAIVLLLVFAAVDTRSLRNEDEMSVVKRYDCDAHCSYPGGCWGQYGACKGICYCYGSGLAYRCNYCDV